MPTNTAKSPQSPVEARGATRTRKRYLHTPKAGKTPLRESSRVYFSGVLEQHYEIAPDGTIRFEDGTDYDRREIVRLRDASPEVIREVHALKRVFDGEVVS
jgi:hypothetical protein